MNSCNYYSNYTCHSCSTIETDYSSQIELKEHHLDSLIDANLKYTPTLYTTVHSRPWHFRNKAKMIVAGNSRKPIIGIVRQEDTGHKGRGNSPLDRAMQSRRYHQQQFSSQAAFGSGPLSGNSYRARNDQPELFHHKKFTSSDPFQVHEILSCPLHTQVLNRVIKSLKYIISKYQIHPYNIAKRSGELKALIIFASEFSDNNNSEDEMYLRFVLRSKNEIDKIKSAMPEIMEKFPSIKVITANIQPVAHAVLEGDEEIYLTEEKFIKDKMGDFLLTITPGTFYQTNPRVAHRLYEAAQKIVYSIDPDTLWDMYCGVGAFSLYCANDVRKKIVAVEASAKSIECAKINQTAYNLTSKIDFIRSNAEDFLRDRMEQQSPDVMIVNPPRKGLSSDMLSMILSKKYKIRDIIYSSCNAETLFRDIRDLEQFYRVKSLQIFDMFPHTHHYETLAYLVAKHA
ncbi:MAG: methyltransferase domain-containing protein [Oligoflexia bacterium]|nr:methyltransferase domain-containing protein [Oligoflexia bacterium]